MSDPFINVICHSISPQGIPLITVHMRYWRGIHAEVMTHRAFSRNARSSRAVPIKTMIDEVRKDPFIPRHWGKNQKGMQAAEEHDEIVLIRSMDWLAGCESQMSCTRKEAWLVARDRAAEAAEGFMNAGYHKQLANRLLEPFMWIDTLVTATDWANFMALRDHKDAEPHIRDLAQQVKEALGKSEPQKLNPGMWHLPYIKPQELDLWFNGPDGIPDFEGGYELARRVSAARCARISYAPFDGNPSLEAELDRFNKLVGTQPVHASPVEHQATPDTQIREFGGYEWAHPHEHRNFRGWRQFRAMIPAETVRDAA